MAEMRIKRVIALGAMPFYSTVVISLFNEESSLAERKPRLSQIKKKRGQTSGINAFWNKSSGTDFLTKVNGAAL